MMARQADTLRWYSPEFEVPAGMNALINAGKYIDTVNPLSPTGTDKQAPVTLQVVTCKHLKLACREAGYFPIFL